MPAVSKGKCVSSEWTCLHVVSICVHGGLQEGGLLQIQEDIQAAFPVSLEGVHPYYVATSRGHLLLLPLTGNTSAGVRFELCNLNSEGPAKQTSCSPEMFGEGRGLPESYVAHKTNKALGCRMKTYKGSPSTGVLSEKTWQAGRAAWREEQWCSMAIHHSIHTQDDVWIILSQNPVLPHIKHNKQCMCYLNWWSQLVSEHTDVLVTTDLSVCVCPQDT